MPESLGIRDVRRVPASAALAGRWIRETWGPLPVHDYLRAVEQGGAWPSPLPRTLVAVDDGVAIGTCSVLEGDLETRPDLNPWIGCLFVLPDRRRQGVGRLLLQAAEALAGGELEIKTAYLFTEGQERMYGRLGWRSLAADEYRGRPVTIMRKELGSAAGLGTEVR